MPKKEAPLEQLEDYLPAGSGSLIFNYLHTYRVHLTITRSRKSVLGDYRHTTTNRNHRISINGNLNKYAFLITLVHELAHLVTFMQFENRVQAHGREWKLVYRKILEEFIGLQIFPVDILTAFKRSLHDLPASSCADEQLMRVLRNYDQKPRNAVFVEQLEEGGLFEIDGGQLFRRGKIVRKRYQCVEINSGKLYLFSPIYEVIAV